MRATASARASSAMSSAARVLLHLIDVTGDDPVAAYRVIRKELKAYSPELAEKPEMIAFNKIDLLQDDEIETKLKDFKRRVRKTPILISGATDQGRAARR